MRNGTVAVLVGLGTGSMDTQFEDVVTDPDSKDPYAVWKARIEIVTRLNT